MAGETLIEKKKWRKRLKPHAATCIKMKVTEAIRNNSPNVDVAYALFCDRTEDCWDCTELIENEMGVVNVVENGLVIRGDERRHTLPDGTGICIKRASLEIQIEVYVSGCEEDAKGVAMAIYADAVAAATAAEPSELCVKQFDEVDVRPETESSYSDGKALIIGTFTADILYSQNRPSLIFE